MKTKILLLSLLTFALAACSNEQESVSQVSKDETLVVPLPCRVDTEGYTPAPKDVTKSGLTKADMPEKIIIPVVFHVFGADQGSGKIDQARIERVIKWINNDFHGVKNIADNHWNENIVSEFDAVKAVLPEVEFRLAQFDPDGKPHTGLCMHTVAEGKGGGKGKGLGNSRGEEYVKKYAWNNKMYMNVYITNNMYGYATNDSGVAWPPSMSMTNAGTARVVYNGSFLPGGNFFDKDFTSIITHEFGHFFNLKHTFDGGCVAGRPDDNTSGDFCGDTPQADDSNLGIADKNCNGVITNYENYMNYGVYANWTKDQKDRMITAMLTEPSRTCLWAAENLKNTLGIGGTPTPKPEPSKDPATMGDKLDYLDKVVSGK